MTISTRRAALGAILAAPLASVPVVSARTQLIAKCDWAVEQNTTFHNRCIAEDWDDDRIDAEVDLYDDAFTSALNEPSQTLADLRAKARLCLVDFKRTTFPFIKPEENREPDDTERMIMLALEEVIKLCA